MKYFLCCLLILIGTTEQCMANEKYLPQQIHLSYTGNPTEIMITYTTLLNTNNATVRYSSIYKIPFLSLEVNSTNISKFTDGGALQRTVYINRVLLTDLSPRTQYYYICGTEKYGWSSIYSFTTMKIMGSNEPTKIIFYGDFGDTNSISLSHIQSRVMMDNIDAILHIGDMAYNLADDNGLVGDQFMIDIEPIAAYVPYMTAVGNHEHAYNYSHYINRFSMPNREISNNMFYSWNIGSAHIISFSSEMYFVPDTSTITEDIKQVYIQYKWLENDLTKANEPKNRKLWPWIITMAHRPFYCSNPVGDACSWAINPVRDGILSRGQLRYGLEDLFYNYDVDLELWGHEHTYERLLPVYKKKTYTQNITYHNGTSYYNKPIVPVNIISGAPGNKEMNGEPVVFTNNSWNGMTTNQYGYSYIEICNSTHLHINYFNGETNEIIDDLWIIK